MILQRNNEKGGKVIGMDPKIKKRIVIDVIKLLDKNRLLTDEAKEVLIAAEAVLNGDDEEFWEEFWDELWEEAQGREKTREKRIIIGYLIIAFLSMAVGMATSVVTTLFVRLILIG